MQLLIQKVRHTFLAVHQVAWWKQAIAVILIYITAYISQLFTTYLGTGSSPIWIPTGIVVGLFAVWGYPLWLGVWLGLLAGESILYNPWENWANFVLTTSIASATTIAGIFSVYLIRYLNHNQYFLSRTKYTINFIILGCFISRIPIALICVILLYSFQKISLKLAPDIALTWWLGDSFAILIFTPFIIACQESLVTFKSLLKKNWLEASLIIFCVLILIQIIANGYHIEYCLVPFLVWSAFKFRELGSTGLMLLIAVMMVMIIVDGKDQEAMKYPLLLLQSFLACIGMTTLMLNAVLNENNEANNALSLANITLINQNKQLQELYEQKDLERQQREQILIEYNQALEQQINLAQAKEAAESEAKAKSTFIANMSHELRSPLNAVLGFSQLMLRSKNLPPEQYENAGIIQRSGEYLLNLINNILDYSKIEAGKTILNPHNFDLYRLLDDLEDMLYLKAMNAGLELVVIKDNHLPQYIYTDEVKLRQILLNLLSNSIKFTSEGEIVLSVTCNQDNQQEKSNLYRLNFMVKDTGKGIAPNEFNNLFQAFSQTESGRNSQEGTGLGLAICRQFVQLMGGEITVTSELNQGTTFQFFIQVSPGQTIPAQASFASRKVIALAPNQPVYRLLVVDDKAINRQLLIKLLAPFGFAMKEASNGQEAIAVWEEWEPHLIFMDMRMPVMDGYEATEYIKSQVKGSATAVVALTASVLEEEKAIVLSAGCDDFIRKPFKENTIFESLTKHLGVTYIYENALDKDYEDSRQDKLRPEQFQVMPQEWLMRLSDAALEANTNQVMNLIQEIPTSEVILIKNLTKLVRSFQFEQVLDIIEPLINVS